MSRPELPGVLSAVMRAAVDSAVHGAVIRFQDELRAMDGQEDMAIALASLAATNALETFRSYCANELRLIEAHYEHKRLDFYLRAPTLIVPKEPL